MYDVLSRKAGGGRGDVGGDDGAGVEDAEAADGGSSPDDARDVTNAAEDRASEKKKTKKKKKNKAGGGGGDGWQVVPAAKARHAPGRAGGPTNTHSSAEGTTSGTGHPGEVPAIHADPTTGGSTRAGSSGHRRKGVSPSPLRVPPVPPRPPPVVIIAAGPPCIGKTTVLLGLSLMHPNAIQHDTRDASPTPAVFHQVLVTHLEAYAHGVVPQRVLVADACHITRRARRRVARAVREAWAGCQRGVARVSQLRVVYVDFAAVWESGDGSAASQRRCHFADPAELSRARALLAERLRGRLDAPKGGGERVPPPGLGRDSAHAAIADYIRAYEAVAPDELAHAEATPDVDVLRVPVLGTSAGKLAAVRAWLRGVMAAADAAGAAGANGDAVDLESAASAAALDDAARDMTPAEALAAVVMRTGLRGRGGRALREADGDAANRTPKDAGNARFDQVTFPKRVLDVLRKRAARDLGLPAPFPEGQEFHVTLAYYPAGELSQRQREAMAARIGEWVRCRVVALVRDRSCACYAVDVETIHDDDDDGDGALRSDKNEGGGRPRTPPRLPRPVDKRYHITLTTTGVKAVYSNSLLDVAATAIAREKERMMGTAGAAIDVMDMGLFREGYRGGGGEIVVQPLDFAVDGYVNRCDARGRDVLQPFETGCGVPEWAWDVPEFCRAATAANALTQRFCRARGEGT